MAESDFVKIDRDLRIIAGYLGSILEELKRMNDERAKNNDMVIDKYMKAVDEVLEKVKTMKVP